MSPARPRPFRRVLVLGAMIIGAFVALAAAISVDGLHDRLGKADVGVVLGTKVGRDGTPSIALAARLDEAVALYRQGYFPAVIVSGGLGREGYDEATVMKAYLVRRGLPDAAIVVDSRGVNTKATAHDSAEWMAAHGARTALVVSQYYHLSRSRLAFQRCGVETVYAAHARLFLWRDVYAVSRDALGFVGYLLADRGCPQS